MSVDFFLMGYEAALWPLLMTERKESKEVKIDKNMGDLQGK